MAGILLLTGSGSGFCRTSSEQQNNKLPVILPEIRIIKGTVKRGDTFSTIMNAHVPLRTIYQISDQSRNVFSMARIQLHHRYKIILQDDALVGFEYDIDQETRVIVQKENGQFSVFLAPIEFDVEQDVVSATIHSSLFEAVRAAGEKPDLAGNLSDIFAWDIDFIRDIQPGDQFRVLVEKRYRDGRFFGYGKIQAAFFMNKGIVFKAFLHKDADGISGYYDETGKSLQKAFLKAPLAFSRISSTFTTKRLHPIFKEYRPHPGVDYAAPQGTPIKSVGDGVITQIGFNKGMGNFITIRHSNGYTTGYNHMSGFTKNMVVNKRVQQGDVIGFVGMTGYATGPHLDFRMRKDGKPVDPLKYKSPSAKPVNPDEIAAFLAKARELSRKIITADQFASIDKPST